MILERGWAGEVEGGNGWKLGFRGDMVGNSPEEKIMKS